jgi:hypothetical protein
MAEQSLSQSLASAPAPTPPAYWFVTRFAYDGWIGMSNWNERETLCFIGDSQAACEMIIARILRVPELTEQNKMKSWDGCSQCDASDYSCRRLHAREVASYAAKGGKCRGRANDPIYTIWSYKKHDPAAPLPFYLEDKDSDEDEPDKAKSAADEDDTDTEEDVKSEAAAAAAAPAPAAAAAPAPTQVQSTSPPPTSAV